MKYWIAATAACLLAATPLLAADAPQKPVTANKVEGPVTGALPDQIPLSIDPGTSNTPSLHNTEALRVSFCMETTTYEKMLIAGNYVKQPRVHCITPDRKLHLAGKRQLTGITMVPEIAGEWRWSSDYSLNFKPKKTWPTGQNFQVNFAKDVFEAPVTLTNGSYSFVSESLVPQINSMVFFQDENDVEKKGVNATVRFNAPVDADALKQHLEFTLEELVEQPKPGVYKSVAKAETLPFELKLNERGTEAVVTVALKSLPDKERNLRANVKPGLMSKAGGEPFKLAQKNPGRFEERVAIPSRFSYAKINKIEARIVKNDRFEPEQVLIITTNVPVTTEELGKHLKLHQLPKDKESEISGYSPKKDYAWSTTSEVSEELLKKTPEVSYTSIPTAETYSTLHSVKLDTTPGSWLYARITGGLNAKGDYVLAQDYNDTLNVPDYGKEVKILSDGALLSLSGEKKISVYSLGASKLKFQVRRVITNDIGHFISQTRGNFEDPEFEGSFSENNLSEVFSEDRDVPGNDPRKPQFTAFDFTPYLKKNPDAKGLLFKDDPNGKGLFFLNIEGINKDKDGKDVTVSSERRSCWCRIWASS